MDPMDIDLREIVPVSAGQPAAFEELCCQLARRSEQPQPFVRLRGDGGDGGIEGYVESTDGKRGWQAKYVFDPSRLVQQASKSFRTALENHPDLRVFVLCFPFDLTGRTGRGQGSVQKLDDWRTSERHYTEKIGRDVKIEWWSASELRTRLIEYDVSGGMRHFFFGKHNLTNQWFERHLSQAQATAGPRYTPELNVSTDMGIWFAAFGRTSAWLDALSTRLRSLQVKLSHLRLSNTDRGKRAQKAAGGSLDDAWPDGLALRVATHVTTIKEVVATLQRAEDLSSQEYSELKVSLRSAASDLRDAGKELALDINSRHGEGAADSPGFRQYMAEWMAALPAANLDSMRDVVAVLDDLVDWLDSPAFALAFETSFVLTGEAGTGKTHGVCDIAHQRHAAGHRTCLLFGHQFMDEPDPWTRIAETLDMTGLGRDQLLDAMDSAGEASGAPLFMCIDAINETKPLGYWCSHLMPMLQVVSCRRFLRICIVCRTPYARVCLPEQNKLLQVEHQGFSGQEREACRAYCKHYGLQPPTLPILQPELRNPLYLRLICETAQQLRLQRLPLDWSGSVKAIEKFLQQKGAAFAADHQVPVHANFMQSTLTALVDYLVDHAVVDVAWSTAIDAVLERITGVDREQAARYLGWLVGEGLLIDDAPRESYAGAEGMLRPAFERLGDFLVAKAVLGDSSDAPLALTRWLGTVEDIERHSGILGVLSALLAEHRGAELSDMTDDPERSGALLKLTIDCLPSRSGAAFTDRLKALVYRALSLADLSFRTMDALVSIAWRPSPLDAQWLDDLLRSQPLAERDAFWCGFLHESFSKGRSVAELIDAAREIGPEELDRSIVERWARLLLWLTAAADRRVKDGATRAAVAVLAGQPTTLPTLIATMLSIDDDAVRERLLLVAYGVLLQTRRLDTLRDVASMLHRNYTDAPSAFSNALVRDHIRAICELAAHLDVLPASIDPQFASEAVGGGWPLALPSEDTKAWSKSIRLWPGNFGSDFFNYSMSCMKQWQGGMCRENMAKWILQTVAQDFGFFGSACESYDRRMLHDHGGGRGKPVWAERIGKKYLWIAMYQLASRLHDNVVPKRDDYKPEPIRTPFILAEGRQLDPTLRNSRKDPQRHQFFATPRLGTATLKDDNAWIVHQEDVPRLSDLVKTQCVGNQDWCPLVAYLSSDRPRGQEVFPYRQIWLHLFGYLVRSSCAAPFLEKLEGRNFFGRWMPEGIQLGYDGGFLAEYPWATPFNCMPEDWYSTASDDRITEFLTPAWNNLLGEWEYDETLGRANTPIDVCVPSRVLLDGDGLWSDGQGAYTRPDGRTVFLDPSVRQEGPSILMADAQHLGAKLEELDRCLVWTLLGEKWMPGGSMSEETERTSMRTTFSQVALMDAEGTIQETSLAIFDDPNDRTGLA